MKNGILKLNILRVQVTYLESPNATVFFNKVRQLHIYIYTRIITYRRCLAGKEQYSVVVTSECVRESDSRERILCSVCLLTPDIVGTSGEVDL